MVLSLIVPAAASSIKAAAAGSVMAHMKEVAQAAGVTRPHLVGAAVGATGALLAKRGIDDVVMAERLRQAQRQQRQW